MEEETIVAAMNIPPKKEHLEAVAKFSNKIKELEAMMNAANFQKNAVEGAAGIENMSRQQLARTFVMQTGEIAKLNRMHEKQGGYNASLVKRVATHKLMLEAVEIQYVRRLREGAPLDHEAPVDLEDYVTMKPYI